jgi:hypothetical protein
VVAKWITILSKLDRNPQCLSPRTKNQTDQPGYIRILADDSAFYQATSASLHKEWHIFFSRNLRSLARIKIFKMAVESGTSSTPQDATKEAETVIVGRDVEEVTTQSYHPSKWQSNITIISCVSANLTYSTT